MRRIAALAAALMLHGCGDFPKDSRETLARAKAGEPLKVGYSTAEPWVRDPAAGAEPAGVEPDLIRAWARAEGVRIEWVKGSEQQLVDALSRNELDLAVGGFISNSPHGAMVGMTQPYLSAPIVIGAAPGADPPEEWKGVPVRYDARRPNFAPVVAKQKARPVPADAAGLRPFAAVYEAELAALGLHSTGKPISTEKHVIAGAPAENALIFSLDRFVHAHKDAIESRLGQEAGR